MDAFVNLPISLLICMVFAFVANGADIGEPCQVARSGAQGVCQVINSCKPVIDEIVNQGLFPAQCGFRGRDQIVCCPVPVTVTPRPTTPPPTRISQRSELTMATVATWLPMSTMTSIIIERLLWKSATNIKWIYVIFSSSFDVCVFSSFFFFSFAVVVDDALTLSPSIVVCVVMVVVRMRALMKNVYSMKMQNMKHIGAVV